MMLLTLLTMTMEAKFSNLLKLQKQAVDENTPSDRLVEIARISTELARFVAANLNAPISLLRELSNSKDIATRQNIAANPKTPIDVLFYLGSEFPEQLLNNPSFSLFLLDNPNLATQIPLETLRSIVRYKVVPFCLIDRAVNQLDKETLLALAENPETSKEVLQKLIQSRYASVAEAAKLHVNLAGEITEISQEETIEAIWNSEMNGQKLGDFLEQLSKINALPESFIKSFSNDRTAVYILEDLAKYNHVLLCQTLANNPNTPAGILQDLAKDNYRGVRQNVAKNPNTPIEVLEILLSDCCESVRKFAIARYLAENPEKLSVVLNHYPLEYSAPCFSRLILLMCPQFPIKLVEKFSSLVWLERYAIAQHPHTSPDMLKLLVNDSNRIVRAAAKARIYRIYR
ncbi:hypothetical protein BCD67_08955 [Oscillatoriales cyanobacterium USR001]|nr:hypothetical protein BCD67_08955 [Oscillatoriales cyanobacterium USR001]